MRDRRIVFLGVTSNEIRTIQAVDDAPGVSPILGPGVEIVRQLLVREGALNHACENDLRRDFGV